MKNLTLEQRVSIPEDVVFQQVGDETVILNLETAVYFGLDAVGARVWELLEKGNTLRSVFDSLKKEYEVDSEELRRDLLNLIGALEEKGLVLIEA